MEISKTEMHHPSAKTHGMDSDDLNSSPYFPTYKLCKVKTVNHTEIFFSLLLLPSKIIPMLSKIFFFIKNNNEKSWQ